MDEEYRLKQKQKRLHKMHQAKIQRHKELGRQSLNDDYESGYDDWPVIIIPVVFHII